jgi:hypothetical protein
MCECSTIIDTSEVCDQNCQSTKTIPVITDTGSIRVTDPVSGQVGEVDPSTIPGYYGEFKTASQSGAKTNNALFLDVGDDFSYGFDVNEDILRATDITEQTDKSTVV